MRKLLALVAILTSFACNPAKASEFADPQPCTQPAPLPNPTPIGTGFYQAKNGKVYKDGAELQLRGVNWFGMEGRDLKLHGLWTGRSMQSFVDQMQALGFNAFRIPVSPEALQPGRPGSDGFSSPTAQLEALLKYTAGKNMYVLLDLHQCSSAGSHADKPGPGLGVCAQYGYGEAQWTKDLQTLAKLSAAHKNVVGIDLFNEPYGFKWNDWKAMAERGAAAILKINPSTLIFVEGVGNDSDNGGFGTFWGENLVEAGRNPPAIPRDRLVLSPHVYGPSVFAGMDYFANGYFPANMPQIWEKHFGYLVKDGYTLVFGEFGGRYEGKDKIWQDAWVDYMKSKGLKNYFYWSMNPNSGDTGGILTDDWQGVNQDKVKLLKRL